MTKTLGGVLDMRANGLNFVRLLLAGSVIVWHAIRLSGHDLEWMPLRRILSEGGVDGFFAISGFLIVSSWFRTPDWRRYLRARLFRIMPAFWVCLAVTALVIAPLTAGVFGTENLTYIAKNAALRMFQYDIAGTPLGIPTEGTWNGSLWTLFWEFLCYLGVLAIGVAGLFRFRFVLPGLFLLSVAGAVLVDLGTVSNYYATQSARFAPMFLAGAVIWQYRDRIPVNTPLIAVAIAAVAGSTFLPNYRLVAALPLAYLILLLGSVITTPALRLRNDISYGVYIYAFPVQQVLALWGAHTLGIGIYAVLAVIGTLPLAIASWFLVEKPAMQLNRAWGRTRATPTV